MLRQVISREDLAGMPPQTDPPPAGTNVHAEATPNTAELSRPQHLQELGAALLVLDRVEALNKAGLFAGHDSS